MAWPYEQNFEGLSLAALDGQDSWQGFPGDGSVDVVNTQASEGSQSVEVSSTSGAGAAMVRSVTASTSGTVYLSIRKSDLVGNFDIRLYAGVRICVIIRFTPTGNIVAFAGGATIQSYSINTWYRIGIEYDSAADTFRINVDNGAWSSTLSYYQTGGDIDKVTLSHVSGGISTVYVDDFSASYVSGGGGGTTKPNYLGLSRL